jgi:hypothetical protein
VIEALIAGAVLGALLMFVVALRVGDTRVAEVRADERTLARADYGYCLTELAQELALVRNAVEYPDGPHPQHAPSRAAYRVGYYDGLNRSLGVLREAYRAYTAHGGRSATDP